MNNNPLILQQLLQNFRNQQMGPGEALQNNLDNRLAIIAGDSTPEQWAVLENERQYYNKHHPIKGYFRDQSHQDTTPGFLYDMFYVLPFVEAPRLLKENFNNLRGAVTGGAAPLGQFGMGNIDLYNRPQIKNPDGSRQQEQY